MRRAGTGKKHNETPEKANGSTDLASIGRFPFGCTEVVAEQFVGAVDKMDLHAMMKPSIHSSRRFVDISGSAAITTLPTTPFTPPALNFRTRSPGHIKHLLFSFSFLKCHIDNRV